MRESCQVLEKQLEKRHTYVTLTIIINTAIISITIFTTTTTTITIIPTITTSITVIPAITRFVTQSDAASLTPVAEAGAKQG